MSSGVYPRRVKRHAVIQPLDPSYKIIALTQGRFTTVDAADYPWLNQWPWYAYWNAHTHSFYAARNEKRKRIYMAREILKCGPKEEAEHQNHDTLDNQRKNLRKATSSQNSSNRRIRSDNTSGFKGVSWCKKTKNWKAMIGHKGTQIYLGYFNSAEEAARAYDEAAKKFHGEFASLNF